MKSFWVIVVFCSLNVTACSKSAPLHLVCEGEVRPDIGPGGNWNKEFHVDLASGYLSGYVSDWHTMAADAKTTTAVEVDKSFIMIYDSLVDEDPKQFKVILVSRLTGELTVIDMPENKVTVAGTCSGATG